MNLKTEQEDKMGLSVTDIFSKFISISPIKTKGEGDVAAALLESVVRIGGKPKILYTDDEASFNSKLMNKYYQEENITLFIARTHAYYAERCIRVEEMVNRRIKGTNKDWSGEISVQVVSTCVYKMKPSVTGFTPADGRKSENVA